MAVIVEKNEIWLTGTVGAYWWDDGFTAENVVFALAQVGRSTDVVVHLNSGGGVASEGAAIHAQLAAHKGKVEIVVEGVAASAASVIAMAANRLVMSLGAVLMIHEPMVETVGNVAEHQKSIAYLDTLGASYAAIYADKTGKTAEEMRSLMAAETWMTAEEAVTAGFADATAPAVARAANDNEPTAFAYGAYAHAPKALASLAEARGWKQLRPPAPPKATASTTTPPPASTEEPTMTTTPKTQTPPTPEAQADAGATAKARIKAILTADAAKGRQALADHLAYETDLTVEAALATLAAAAEGGDAPASTDPAAGYAARRQSAAALAAPGGEPEKRKSPIAAIDPKAIYAKRAAARR